MIMEEITQELDDERKADFKREIKRGIEYLETLREKLAKQKENVKKVSEQIAKLVHQANANMTFQEAIKAVFVPTDYDISRGFPERKKEKNKGHS